MPFSFLPFSLQSCLSGFKKGLSLSLATYNFLQELLFKKKPNHNLTLKSSWDFKADEEKSFVGIMAAE